ncbi:MAG: AAA family ATPase [Sandaracinaceae bacterium]
MKLKSIQLERFRQFKDTTFEFGDVNVLVGPNNSGKTSVLHAIRAFFGLMHGHVRFEGTPPRAKYHRRFLAGPEEVAPAPDLRELWHQQQVGQPLKLKATFTDGAEFVVMLRQQFGQIHVSTEPLPAGLTAAKATAYLGQPVAFIPGLVGVLVEEPFATLARRNSLATQGRYSEIFRSSLVQLRERDSDAVAKINESLGDLFGITVTQIIFDMDTDEHVTVRYKQDGVEYDVVSSGSGLQQIIQVLTYLYLAKPKFLLIDEPDAHLHSKLQARLGAVLRQVAKDLDAQLFVSTHSVDLADTFQTDQVMVVDRGKDRIAALGNQSGLVEHLVDAGVVDVSSLSRILASRRLVVIEDKDQTVLKAIDKTIGSPLYSSSSSSYVLPAKGVSNFRAIGDLGRVLSGLTGTPFEIVFVQDRDGMPDFMEEQFLESQSQDGVAPRVLGRHEIESYLIDPGLIAAARDRVGLPLEAADAESAILAAADDLKAEARRMARETARGINRHLDDGKKWKDAQLEIDVDRWFDGLDLRSLDVVRTVFPGKELLKETLKRVNDGAAKQVTRGTLIAALDAGVIPDTLKDFLSKLA